MMFPEIASIRLRNANATLLEDEIRLRDITGDVQVDNNSLGLLRMDPSDTREYNGPINLIHPLRY